jgi:hypothetical protein
MQRAAVGIKDLDAAVLRSHAITGEQRHRYRRRFSAAVAFEHSGAVNDGDVRWRIRCDLLRARR